MRTEDEIKAKIDGYVQALLRANPNDPLAISNIQARVDMLAWVLEGNEK